MSVWPFKNGRLARLVPPSGAVWPDTPPDTPPDTHQTLHQGIVNRASMAIKPHHPRLRGRGFIIALVSRFSPMTFDEIQQTLERMLAVQRELQESQLKLLTAQKEQSRMIDRLIGYSISNETDHLNLEERLNALGERVRQLENG